MCKNKYEYYKNIISSLKEKSNYRKLIHTKYYEANNIIVNNKKMLNFSSNDYLGIARNKKLKAEFTSKLDLKSIEFSSSSSRLLCGNEDSYQKLETQIAQWYERESALVFSSGYHLNTGVIPAIAHKGDLILSDKLNHASIVDGCKLSDAIVFRYRHLDYVQIENYLKEKRKLYNNVWLISESIFSMDGDCVDIDKLIEIKEKYTLNLYIDEAHAVGSVGDKGRGLSEKNNNIRKIDIIAGTFGKALASYGAFLVCDDLLSQYLINKTRTLIFTTALAPIQLQWTSFVIGKIKTMQHNRIILNEKSKYLKNKLTKKGYKVVGDSHIVSLIIGENSKTIAKSNELLESGVFAVAIRPPTVAKGTSRIRISINYNMSNSLINKIIGVF